MDIRFYLFSGPNTVPPKWAGQFGTGIEYSDGSATNVSFTIISSEGTSGVNIGAGGADGSEDAAWVPGDITERARGFNDFPALAEWKISGLEPNSSGAIELYGIASTGNRFVRNRVNGSEFYLLDIVANLTRTVVIPFTADAQGEIFIESGGTEDTDGTAVLSAVRVIDAEPTAQLTPTQPPQGGEIFSFSGSNYAAQPTGPMTFAQGTRTISRAVTISNWDAEDGSFTGVTDTALPGVPASGASDTPALLYGEPVTISLPDPGA